MKQISANKIVVTSLAVAVVALAVADIAGHASAAARPIQRAACVTFDVTGQVSGPGMAWDEPVTFCGTGMPAGAWICPAKTAALGPGARLACRQP